MDAIPELFAAWLSVHALHAGAPIALGPPADDAEIARVERETGHALPEQVRAIYLVADGQLDPEDDGVSGATLPLFTKSRFESIDEALDARRRLLRDDGEVHFSSDWFPFATDGERSGWAVDLGGDDDGARGEIIRFGPTRATGMRLSEALGTTLTLGLEHRDPLALHRRSDDPRLAHLGHWYRSRVARPSLDVESELTRALEPWLIESEQTRALNWLSEDGAPDIAERYPLMLAAQIDQLSACTGDIVAVSEGTRLANDWLLDAELISRREHEQLEAIRLDRDGARQRLLERGTRKVSTEGSGCSHSISWELEETSFSLSYFVP